MSAKRGLRSTDKQAVKDFGVSNFLPQTPLSKRDILARYTGFVGTTKYTIRGTYKENLSCHNANLSEKNIAKAMCGEDLYKIFGIKTIASRNITATILKVKKEYYKSLKCPETKARFTLDDEV